MDPSHLQYLILFCLILHINSHKPNAISIPVTKDAFTHQYLAQIKIGTPQISIKLVLDLGAPFLWLDCASKHVSSSHNLIQSTSLHCSLPNVNNNCTLYTKNRITQLAAAGDLAEEILAVNHIDRSNKYSVSTIHPLLFSCAPVLLLSGLASSAKGMLGLGKTRLALPSQLAAVSHHQQKFAMCLSSSDGVIVSGMDRFITDTGTDILNSLVYTPLIYTQEEYYINAKSVKINGKRLSIDKSNVKISTIVPYTTMESRIYEIFTKAYVMAANSMNMTRVGAVSPFGLCFISKGVGETRVGPRVPEIELVLQSEMVKWKIYGRNSMVKVSDEVMCLGFLDGGVSLNSWIVIGGYQLEDNFLEFNLGTSMLGFSSSLLGRGTSCSKFIFNHL